MIILLVQFLLVAGAGLVAAQNDCQPASCSNTGPAIRFPFRLTDRQPEHCGYPGFEVSCTRDGDAEFQLQFPITATASNIVIPIPVRVSLQGIDYTSQIMTVTNFNVSCLPEKPPVMNSSASPFNIVEGNFRGYTLFNCTSNSSEDRGGIPIPIACLGGHGYQVYAISSVYSILEIPLSFCFKMYNISYIPSDVFSGTNNQVRLSWSEPYCGNCEAEGKYCGFKSNGTGRETGCFDIPKEPGSDKGVSKKVIAGAVVGSLCLSIPAAVALYHFLRLRWKKEDEKRIEIFLEDYKALRPTRYTYADIKKIADGFKEKLGQGGYGSVYKGKLSNDILVAVKVLDNSKGNGDDFVNEVSTIGRIHHVNVVRLVGYCADGYRRALVYEFLQNDSLEKFISSRNQGQSLGWDKLNQIAAGIAKGIDYLHQGCNQRIVHFDIKPHNILLDQNMNPKVADFGLAKLCSREQSIVTMTAARGTIGYIAPEVFSRNFGNVSYKSDIYSYGMLLLDMVGGRSRFHARTADSSQIYFPEWMYNQLEKGGDIAIQIEKEDDNKIIKTLTIVGLWCIQWYPADRPSMKAVIQMLEGEDLPIMPPNPFSNTNSDKTSPTLGGNHSNSDLESISEDSITASVSL